jgi:hypothetical protein
MKHCLFNGDVDLSLCSVPSLNLSHSSFRKQTILLKMKVSGPIRLIGADFKGHSDFTSLDSKDVLDVRDSTFDDSVTFAYCHLDVGVFNRATFHHAARFYGMRVDTFLDCGGGVVSDRWFRMRNVRIDGDCDFTDAQFNGSVDLKDTSVRGTIYVDATWPDCTRDKDRIQLDRLTYGAMYPLDKAIILVTRARYSPQAYTMLETILRTDGQVDEANQVGYDRARGLRLSSGWFSPSAWWNWLLMLFVGNGYYPVRAVWWALLIVGIGGLGFRPGFMAPKDPAAPGLPYNPWLYSLDLFIPGISLDIAERWHPRPGLEWLRAWMYAERVLGWIIVPVGLLALTGLVKP